VRRSSIGSGPLANRLGRATTIQPRAGRFFRSALSHRGLRFVTPAISGLRSEADARPNAIATMRSGRAKRAERQYALTRKKSAFARLFGRYCGIEPNISAIFR
jgi:hypothetical protein